MQAFSGDELVFNDTMKDWRTHNGMDLAGAAGGAGTALWWPALMRTPSGAALWS